MHGAKIRVNLGAGLDENGEDAARAAAAGQDGGAEAGAE